VVLVLAAGGCDDDDDGGPPKVPSDAFAGVVTDTAGLPVEGALVYLVPADDVSTDPITAAGVLAGTVEDFDEPLEDLVAGAGATMDSVVTDAGGGFRFRPLVDGRYFVYVEPGAADGEHLPGGSLCRQALDADELRGQSIDIQVSSSPPPAATYVGMSVCLACHTEDATEKEVAHRLGFKVPGEFSGLQDLGAHPEIDEGLTFFTPGADHTAGTPVFHYDYDATRGFDKFAASLSDPSVAGGIVYARLWLWQDVADGRYKITFENVGNPADPLDLTTREVELTYGGAVYKQRYMIRWPGLNGLYPLLQFQSEGDESKYDRTRRQFRDYHLDFFWDDGGTPADPSDDLLRAPDPTRNIQRNCMGCHAVGYQQFTDAVTGEVLCDTIEDPYGEYDIDGDGRVNDINLGCEGCHGPGSEHVTALEGRWILSPRNLTPEREVMICARCHDRQVGNGTIANGHPLNSADEWPLPGISRAEYLAEHVTRKGPAEGDFWADFAHSKSHHQQGADFLKSAHYRNSTRLVTCSDCHDVHGGTGYPRALVADPRAPDTPLCMGCHGEALGSTGEHTAAVLPFEHGAGLARCVDCHMTRTSKTGAGEYGLLLGPPTGGPGDDDLTYFTNDISSHLFDVPRKDNVGFAGVQPAQAMPIPYTDECGLCHTP
jgi:predicted CXXCH cytochrome family protein